MSNETTILRFEYGERPQEIKAGTLIQIVNELERAFVDAVAPLARVDIELYHALPPRRGSIEFHFRPQINVQINIQTPPPGRPDLLAKLAAAAGIAGGIAAVATFLWTAMYGQNGALHGALSPDAQPSPNAAAEILPQLAKPRNLDGLLRACAASGAESVEIQVPDNASVVIFSAADRRARGLVGRRATKWRGGDRETMVHTFNVLGRTPVRMRLDGVTYPFHLASIRSGAGDFKAVLAWTKADTRVPRGQRTAYLKPIDPYDLIPVEPVPVDFEEVQGAFLLGDFVLMR